MRNRLLNITPRQAVLMSAALIVLGISALGIAIVGFRYDPLHAVCWFLGIELFGLAYLWASIDFEGQQAVSLGGLWFQLSIALILIAVVIAQSGTSGQPFPDWGVALFFVSGGIYLASICRRAIKNFQRWRNGEFDPILEPHNEIQNSIESEKMPTNDEYEKIASAWYDRKSAMMESTLGAEHGIVMHALIPYEMGGGLDLYFYPNGIEGTGFATKELSEIPTEGSNNDVFDLYEMVMFTRIPLELELFRDESTAFGQTYKTFNAILNAIALYSRDAKLNPNETCEFPEDMDIIGGKCLIFDAYASHSDPEVETFGLLALIEIFRSEMDYARANGGAKLLDLLKTAGHYPYSDMNREPVE